MGFALHRRFGTRAALIAAAVAAALAGLGSMRWPLASGAVAPLMQQALERHTSYAVESIGETTFSALPWPSLQIADLVLRKPASPEERVEASLVKARINLASWLFGEPKFVGLTLFDPRLRLASEDKLGETEALSAAVLNFLGPAVRPGLRSLRVERGAILRGGTPWLADFRLNVANAGGAGLRIAASGRHEAGAFSVEAEIGPGGAAARKPIRWTASAPGVTAEFSGELFGPRSFDAEGRLSLAIADGSILAQRMRLGTDRARLLDGLTVEGLARIAWPTAQIRQARIARGAMRLDGSIEVSAAGRHPAVAATLDAGALDLTPVLTPLFAGLGDRNGRWSTEPFRTGWMSGASLDLRLSAGRLTAGPVQLEAAAMSAQLGGGRLDMILSEGRLRQGGVKARLSLAGRPEAIDVRGQASADRIDAAQLAELLGLTRMKGAASGQLAFDGSAASLDQLIATAKGRAELSIRDGELFGLDLDRVSSRAERIAGGAPPPDGRTRFSTLTLQMRLAQGKATLHDSAIVTPVMRAPIEGGVGVDNRSFDLTLRPLPGGETPRSGEIRLRIEGPWSNPVLAPDATGRLNRS